MWLVKIQSRVQFSRQNSKREIAVQFTEIFGKIGTRLAHPLWMPI